MVSYLTEELVTRGHQVTLFASGDSVTSARLVASCPRSLRLDANCIDQLAPHVLQLEQLQQELRSFDIIHYHTGHMHFPLARRHTVPHLTTLHGRLDIPDIAALFQEFQDLPMVSISYTQRKPMPRLNWLGTVYHGLPQNLHTFHAEHSDYLAFIGRISPEKRLDRAIDIARRVGMPLKVAAKVDMADKDYFREVVEPLLKDPLVEFVGEIGEEEKDDFLGNAYALLFLIDWPEPFGLVPVEAMACGTPVIAYGHGSVPEILEDGVTGFIVHTQEEAERAVARVADLDRQRCRASFERRFTAERMAQDYLNLYEHLLKGSMSSLFEVGGAALAP